MAVRGWLGLLLFGTPEVRKEASMSGLQPGAGRRDGTAFGLPGLRDMVTRRACSLWRESSTKGSVRRWGDGWSDLGVFVQGYVCVYTRMWPLSLVMCFLLPAGSETSSRICVVP